MTSPRTVGIVGGTGVIGDRVARVRGAGVVDDSDAVARAVLQRALRPRLQHLDEVVACADVVTA